MRIIIDFVIPFCFGFIASRAWRNGDAAIVVMAIIGILADIALVILIRGQRNEQRIETLSV